MSLPLLATVLALASALTHASWNAAVKAGSDRLMSIGMVDATALVLCAAAAPFVAPPDGRAWTFVAVSTVLNTAFRLFLVKAYQLGDFGQMYPIIRGVSPLSVAVLSVLVMGQPLGRTAWFGVALISVGITSLVLSNSRADIRAVPIAYAVCAGLCVAGYTVSDAGGVHAASDLLGYTVYLFLVESVPMPLLALAVRRREALRTLRLQWRLGLFGGLVALLSYTLMLWALSVGGTARVAALRETSVLLAAGIGAFLFKEALGRHRVICAAVVAGGIVLVSL
ncbi:EamA family transporter [Kitasatospora sp. NPDC057015]|uniref:EamA family transporter n=1 Tax=Kitasatospora sp. NPDC057015 TaxID=3346001 RepID=UPI00364344E9